MNANPKECLRCGSANLGGSYNYSYPNVRYIPPRTIFFKDKYATGETIKSLICHDCYVSKEFIEEMREYLKKSNLSPDKEQS